MNDCCFGCPSALGHNGTSGMPKVEKTINSDQRNALCAAEGIKVESKKRTKEYYASMPGNGISS